MIPKLGRLFGKKPKKKWSTARIRERFDAAAECFAGFNEGQPEIVDSALMLELVIEAAGAATPNARQLLDIGCGAGLYACRMLEAMPKLEIALQDLSPKMLEKAAEQVSLRTKQAPRMIEGDIREIELENETYDLITAGAVLHHLRDENEWKAVFTKLYRCLKPGGSLWIVDLVAHSSDAVQEMMWKQYAEYIREIKSRVAGHFSLRLIEKEDSPRPLVYQLDLLKTVGFSEVTILHKNSCFAAFGALK